MSSTTFFQILPLSSLFLLSMHSIICMLGYLSSQSTSHQTTNQAAPSPPTNCLLLLPHAVHLIAERRPCPMFTSVDGRRTRVLFAGPEKVCSCNVRGCMLKSFKCPTRLAGSVPLVPIPAPCCPPAQNHLAYAALFY